MLFLLILIAAAPPSDLDAGKLVLVAGGTLQRYERAPKTGEWRTVGAPMRAVVGKNGISADKIEGDLRTPAGIFPITSASAYEPRAPQVPFVRATKSVKCVDDPKSKYYNRIVDETRVEKDWNSAEDMRLPDDRYRLVLEVGYNLDPTVPGKGSCIFIHIWRAPGAGTAGCIAVAPKDMELLFSWVDKKTQVMIVP